MRRLILFAAVLFAAIIIGCDKPADAQCVNGTCHPAPARRVVHNIVVHRQPIRTVVGRVDQCRPVSGALHRVAHMRPLRHLLGRCCCH